MFFYFCDIIVLEGEEFGIFLGRGIWDDSTAEDDFVVGDTKFFFLADEGDFLHDGEVFRRDFLDGGIVGVEAYSVSGFAITEAINGVGAHHQCHAGSGVWEAEGSFEGDFLVRSEDSCQLFLGFIIDEEVEIW